VEATDLEADPEEMEAIVERRIPNKKAALEDKYGDWRLVVKRCWQLKKWT
jgi:hypothetical protein